LVADGGTAEFEVLVSSCPPLSYTWYYNENNLLIGANGPKLVLQNVVLGQAGTYSVIVRGDYGVVRSRSALLSVAMAPSIIWPPVDTIVHRADTAVLSVTAQGTPPLGYKWYFNETNLLAGQSGPTLTLPNAQNPIDGMYQVVVTNALGSITSAPARLMVVVPARILQAPFSVAVTNGRTATLSALVEGTAPLTYQWFFSESAIPGESGPTLTIPNAQAAQAGSYRITVSNPYGQDSASITLLVVERPSITCVSDKEVEQGVPWQFDVPVATGTNVTLTHVTTTNLLCGTGFAATRVWTATDTGGFQATCSQTVVVKDSRPPTIICGPDKTVVAGDSWDFDEPTGSAAGTVDGFFYRNSANGALNRFAPGSAEFGNEVVVQYPNNYPKRFSFDYWATNAQQASLRGNVRARVRFYANDGDAVEGIGAQPGTVLFDSGLIPVQKATLGHLDIEDFQSGTVPLLEALPARFTWTVQFSGFGSGDSAGLNLHWPPDAGLALITSGKTRGDWQSSGSMPLPDATCGPGSLKLQAATFGRSHKRSRNACATLQRDRSPSAG
jgi:hypothetical protein